MLDCFDEFNVIKLDYKELEENDVIDYILDLEVVENVVIMMGWVVFSVMFIVLCSVWGFGIKLGKVGVELFFIVEIKDCFGNILVEGSYICLL